MPGIVVELGKASRINHIKFLLWDRDTRTYSYYVEVSVDQNNWKTVANYTNFDCRSWQSLYFPRRHVRFIRLVGTNNTVNRGFHVVELEAMYKKTQPELVGDIIQPTYNVATNEFKAKVIEGYNSQFLLNGNINDYNDLFGFT